MAQSTAAPVSDAMLEEPASCCPSKAKSAAPPSSQSAAQPVSWRAYQPIFAIAGAAMLGGLAMAAAGSEGFAWERWMQAGMGLFLFPLALLKLFDLEGFARAFARYDLVTARVPGYGLVYPFLELGLAIALLAGAWTLPVYAATLVIMGLGAIGILRVLARGEAVQCACVGTQIQVPLGVVSVTENVGMAAMAGAMLAAHALA